MLQYISLSGILIILPQDYIISTSLQVWLTHGHVCCEITPLIQWWQSLTDFRPPALHVSLCGYKMPCESNMFEIIWILMHLWTKTKVQQKRKWPAGGSKCFVNMKYLSSNTLLSTSNSQGLPPLNKQHIFSKKLPF